MFEALPNSFISQHISPIITTQAEHMYTSDTAQHKKYTSSLKTKYEIVPDSNACWLCKKLKVWQQDQNKTNKQSSQKNVWLSLKLKEE